MRRSIFCNRLQHKAWPNEIPEVEVKVQSEDDQASVIVAVEPDDALFFAVKYLEVKPQSTDLFLCRYYKFSDSVTEGDDIKMKYTIENIDEEDAQDIGFLVDDELEGEENEMTLGYEETFIGTSPTRIQAST